VGTRNDLKEFLDQHPEKNLLFLLVVAGHIIGWIRRFVSQIIQRDIRITLRRLYSATLDFVAAFVLVSSLFGSTAVPKTYAAIGERLTVRRVRY
jgi:hypothetical protein